MVLRQCQALTGLATCAHGEAKHGPILYCLCRAGIIASCDPATGCIYEPVSCPANCPCTEGVCVCEKECTTLADCPPSPNRCTNVCLSVPALGSGAANGPVYARLRLFSAFLRRWGVLRHDSASLPRAI
jgi:hypothetical protein